MLCDRLCRLWRVHASVCVCVCYMRLYILILPQTERRSSENDMRCVLCIAPPPDTVRSTVPSESSHHTCHKRFYFPEEKHKLPHPLPSSPKYFAKLSVRLCRSCPTDALCRIGRGPVTGSDGPRWWWWCPGREGVCAGVGGCACACVLRMILCVGGLVRAGGWVCV